MAISHVQFVFLFLASLFFSSALCDADFKYCDNNGNEYFDVDNVEFAPDPDPLIESSADIMIEGFARKNIDGGATNVVISYVGSELTRKSYPICDVTMGVRCITEAGTTMSLYLRDVLYYGQEDEVKQQKLEYTVSFEQKQEDGVKTIMCIRFKAPSEISSRTLESA